jgi:hypothetical protein
MDKVEEQREGKRRKMRRMKKKRGKIRKEIKRKRKRKTIMGISTLIQCRTSRGANGATAPGRPNNYT